MSLFNGECLRVHVFIAMAIFCTCMYGGNTYGAKDVSHYELYKINWHTSDSILQSQLKDCGTGIDSIRLLREFTVSLVRSTWDDEYYATARLNDTYTLARLYELYNSDSAVGICSDYADFFAKLLDHYSIRAYPIAAGISGGSLKGHTQVAVRYIYKGRTIVQVHDPMFNLEYIDVMGEPISISEQVRLISSNHYKDSVGIRNGVTPRTILIRKSDWMLVRALYPYKKEIVGRANSENPRFKVLALIKGSLHLMVMNNKKDIRTFARKYVNYEPTNKSKLLRLTLPAYVYQVATVNQDNIGAADIMYMINSARNL